MSDKKISLFVNQFIPNFIVREHPKLVMFLKKFLEYTERYNEVIIFDILNIYEGDYDPEQNGLFYQGQYINIDFLDTEVDRILDLKGNLIKGETSGAIYLVEDVVFSTLDGKYILKARANAGTFLLEGEKVAQVDIGEYTRISNLILYRDIDETIEEFISLHTTEYLFGISSNISTDIKNLIKNIRQFYRSKGTEQSFKFLFRAIFNAEVEFYYPRDDILRVSDGKWFQPYFLQLVDDSNINDFRNLSIRGTTSNTRADVERIVLDFSNDSVPDVPIDVPLGTGTQVSPTEVSYADIDGNGTSMTITITGNGDTLQLVADGVIINGFSGSDVVTVTLSAGEFSTLSFTNEGQTVDVFNFTPVLQNEQFPNGSGFVNGAGGFQLATNGSINAELSIPGPTFSFDHSGSPGSGLKITTVSAENTGGSGGGAGSGGGSSSNDPPMLEVTIKEGELIEGETIVDVNSNSSISGVIQTITEKPGRWLNNDGRLSSDKVLQDNFFYQDFSYVLRTEVSIALFEDLVKKLIHPAGLLLFGEFVAADEVILEVNITIFNSTIVINTETEILEVNLTQENSANILQELASEFFDTTYRKIDENKEDYPWAQLFDTIEQFDNVDLAPFEDNPDDPAYLVPESTLIINN